MKKLFFLMAASFLFAPVHAQITERERPAEWQHLVKGARFMDRFLPMPDGIQAKGIWGTDSVLNRYVDNGIELPGVSFWGGNILQDTEGKYHLFVCGWPENSPKGHMFWSNSTVFHAVSDRLTGPFKIRNSIGKGHNPEAFRLSDGRIVVYVIDGYYIADRVDDKVWTYGKFSFDPRDRKIIEGLSNLTFARRQDGSYLMVCRGGGVWISKDGLSPYKQLTDKRVYPDVEGRTPAVIAELKKASPSAGLIRADFRPGELAKSLAGAGAAALSVLTEKNFFMGSAENLKIAADSVSIPILRKDFIFDKYQICQAKVWGASAVLLIAAMLSRAEFEELFGFAESLGLDALCEAHTEGEISMLASAGAKIIGVNCRNLKNFETDFERVGTLIKLVPQECVKVSESAIGSRETLLKAGEYGADAALIGSELMRASSPADRLLQLLGKK